MLRHNLLLPVALLWVASDLGAQTQSFKYVASDAGPAEGYVASALLNPETDGSEAVAAEA